MEIEARDLNVFDLCAAILFASWVFGQEPMPWYAVFYPYVAMFGLALVIGLFV